MKKLTIITTILAITIQSYCQWTPQDINTDAQLTDVFFLNENIGWVAGNIPPETGIIFKTTDGGITWDSIASVPSGVMELQFVDSLTGWGKLTWNFIEDGIYKTEDGGFTWELIVSGWSEVEFFNENEGVLLDHDNPFPLYSSTDGGGSWDLIDTLIGEHISGMGCLDFINANVGFVVKHWQVLKQTGNILVKTSDGGFTWEPKSCPDDVSDFIFFNENIGYLDNEGYQSGLYKTIDGADSWEKVYDGSVYSSYFSTPEKGWISTYDDAIKYTWDGGLNWETQYSGNAIFDIFFTDSPCGWAVGENGLILNTSNGGGIYTGVDQSKPLPKNLNHHLFYRVLLHYLRKLKRTRFLR
jgi:photosystem II stability/assembly factor-like uncharacterized protein